MARARNQYGYKHGLFSGYTDYRYGDQGKPIKLATVSIQKSKPKPIYRGENKKHLVNQVVDALNDWRKSPFENEGAMRAGLRSAMCHEGNDWSVSDWQAAEVINAAFTIMGAKRPSWEEGQRGYALSTDYCMWCYNAIPEQDRSSGRRFCSVECASFSVQNMARKTNHHYGAILRSALRMIDKSKAPPRDCEYCGISFQTDHSKARFCSSRCAGLFNAGDKVLNERECKFCHTIFKPLAGDILYCSRTCSAKAHAKAKAEQFSHVTLICGCCGEAFTPKNERSTYCSEKCQTLVSKRNYAKRMQEANKPKPRDCKFCGAHFQPKINGTQFCSQKCGSEASRYSRGAVPRAMTRLVFDHFIALPIDQAWNSRLTPQRFDWIIINQGHRVTMEVSQLATP